MYLRSDYPVCPSRDAGACTIETLQGTADRAHKCGDAVYIAVHRVRIVDHHSTVASFGHDHKYIQQASKTTPTMCRSRLERPMPFQ